MTSPFALLLSITGTMCMFILALIGIIADASTAPTPAVEAARAPRTVAVAEQVRHIDSVTFSFVPVPAASHAQARGH